MTTTKIDIISGFLGAGKTTLIKKLLTDAFGDEKIVLIENEFGEIGIDGGFLQDAGIEVREMNSGCICCSLVGDFSEALKKVLVDYAPDRIIIEPSGVGKLSDVITAVRGVAEEMKVTMNSFTTVADAQKCHMYRKNFGEFFNNQIAYANTIVLSRTQNLSEEKLQQAVEEIKEENAKAVIITTPWDQLDGSEILKAMEACDSLEQELLKDAEICPTCGHVHEGHEHHHEHEKEHTHEGHEHHHEHEEEHSHEGHEHHHEHEEEHSHEGHEHHHDHEEEHSHEGHEHHHEHEDSCGCSHEHHDHHHRHADEIFTSYGAETIRKFSQKELKDILDELSKEETYGVILRAKGMLENTDGGWLYFDMVPQEQEIREGKPTYTGRFCVIGSHLHEAALKKLFHVE